MLTASPEAARQTATALPQVIAIRCEPEGYGVRFGLSEAEDEVMRGPVFESLNEALAFIEDIDRARAP